jgi:tetratricopeptide (TPR) repeat protein
VLLACIGCRHEPQVTPDAAYSRIESQLISGDLSTAREQSTEAYEYFKSSRPDWAATFRIELAKVLIYQGASGEASALLQQPLPVASNTESQVRRNIFLSIAQARLGHLDKAEQTLLEAEHQCPEGPLRAEVYSAQGSIDLERGNLDDAERAFQAGLVGGRLSGDRFLQTRALMNLGVVAMQEEHYEDALARFSDASATARSIGAKLVLEKAIGNIGFVYYKTGDFQRSLTNFNEAEKQAAELGSPIDQVRSFNNAGLSEYRLGNIDAARSFYERSLVLAQSIQNQQEILDAHVDLGFLLLRLGNSNAAEVHVREADRIAALMRNDRAGLEPTLLDALLHDARGDKQGATKLLLALEDRTASVPSLQWEAESNLARIYSEVGQPTDAGFGGLLKPFNVRGHHLPASIRLCRSWRTEAISTSVTWSI